LATENNDVGKEPHNCIKNFDTKNEAESGIVGLFFGSFGKAEMVEK